MRGGGGAGTKQNEVSNVADVFFNNTCGHERRQFRVDV